jgi:hypothetical protein
VWVGLDDRREGRGHTDCGVGRVPQQHPGLDALQAVEQLTGVPVERAHIDERRRDLGRGQLFPPAHAVPLQHLVEGVESGFDGVVARREAVAAAPDDTVVVGQRQTHVELNRLVRHPVRPAAQEVERRCPGQLLPEVARAVVAVDRRQVNGPARLRSPG